MNWLELKVPPLALFFGIAAAMLALTWPAALNAPPHPLLLILSVLTAMPGVLVLGLSVHSFIKARTTVMPTNPAAASQLVNRGIYRFSRNPMYLGMALLLISEAAFLNSVLGLMMTLGFTLWITRFQIQPEERVLQQRFGEPFDDYCQRTRRWL
ncbi:methyltransferase family protein [Reinekea blandensis]|uniref:Isoprenylcysteine carboxylmethyltransferase family protein n=1 Tax=Reinekea blandensis MED297 TaxID=314283 RepID=A4B9J3_9GAMM|nr:isoprenylcysteine carboxylmethyltransferase family protein [Reinekea blandensis]EAR11294.1 hypothetical protein MED297_20442 [Reinekea sp. MED297] [Reinekea blandensis MED297]